MSPPGRASRTRFLGAPIESQRWVPPRARRGSLRNPRAAPSAADRRRSARQLGGGHLGLLGLLVSGPRLRHRRWLRANLLMPPIRSRVRLRRAPWPAARRIGSASAHLQRPSMRRAGLGLAGAEPFEAVRGSGVATGGGDEDQRFARTAAREKGGFEGSPAAESCLAPFLEREETRKSPETTFPGARWIA